MTAREWWTSTRPHELLAHLGVSASNRKFRLFSVACCRLLLRHVTVNPWDENIVDVAERFADGLAMRNELEQALTETTSDYTPAFACVNAGNLAGGVEFAHYCAEDAAWAFREHIAHVSDLREDPAALDGRVEAWLSQAHLLHDIFGPLPFRDIDVDPAWLTSDVRLLAQGIYEEKAFGRMPILADALQDAGCDNEEILNHCCAENWEHVRGCWVVDLLLGRPWKEPETQTGG